MIPVVGWIPRGAVRRQPLRHEMSAQELSALRERAAGEARAESRARKAERSVANARSGGGGGGRIAAVMSDPAFASLRGVKLPKAVASMLEDEGDDGEDEDDDDDEDEDEAEVEAGNAATEDEADTPAAFDDDDEAFAEGDEGGEEADEIMARPDDVFLLAAHTEDDYSSLEVHCYNTREGSLYVHHDFSLAALPLCMAWTDYAGAAAGSAMAAQCGLGGVVGGGEAGIAGSYVAVGTFKPDIEIWNLDVLDPLEPALVLKGAASAGGKKKKKGGATAVHSAAAAGSDASGHTDAVMGLSWNRVHRHLIASSSADNTVKIWDTDSGGGAALHTFRHHLGKAQAVAWNPVEATVLASASYDRTAAVLDARAGASGAVARYALPADSEALLWHPTDAACIAVACEDGTVLYFDCRAPDKPLWRIKPHGGAPTTSLSFAALARGFLATGSLDRTVRLWDCNEPAAGGGPTCVASKDVAIGQVFSVAFLPQEPFLLGVGGSKGLVAVWDIRNDGGDLTPAALKAAAKLPPLPAGFEDASPTARRFLPHLLNPADVAAAAVRPRADGQLAGAGVTAAPHGEPAPAADGTAAAAAAAVAKATKK